MDDTNSDVSLDVSLTEASEDVIGTCTGRTDDVSSDVLPTIRTKMANVEKTDELCQQYPSEASRVRQMLGLQVTDMCHS